MDQPSHGSMSYPTPSQQPFNSRRRMRPFGFHNTRIGPFREEAAGSLHREMEQQIYESVVEELEEKPTRSELRHRYSADALVVALQVMYSKLNPEKVTVSMERYLSRARAKTAELSDADFGIWADRMLWQDNDVMTTKMVDLLRQERTQTRNFDAELTNLSINDYHVENQAPEVTKDPGSSCVAEEKEVNLAASESDDEGVGEWTFLKQEDLASSDEGSEEGTMVYTPTQSSYPKPASVGGVSEQEGFDARSFASGEESIVYTPSTTTEGT